MLKRVSFKIANAIKKAGYPQGDTDYKYTKSGNLFIPKNYGDEIKNSECDAPYVMAVWLWLWREKDIYCEIKDGYLYVAGDELDYYSDPEEAIIAAIEHLVTNDLIK